MWNVINDVLNTLCHIPEHSAEFIALTINILLAELESRDILETTKQKSIEKIADN